MKNLFVSCAVAATLSGGTALAALNIPSDGSDGDLVITANTVIDLSLASTNKWDADNSARAGTGVYDAEKWAVVFKYSSVTIGPNATVTFKNHASRAPVVWLVQSNVTISGTVSLNGQSGVLPPGISEPGPGGFRGGMGFYATGANGAAGFGPGGGGTTAGGSFSSDNGGGGSHGTTVGASGGAYGNPSVLPLIGGSGGAGNGSVIGRAQPLTGGAGAGAILIAASGEMAVDGLVRANGGGSSQDSYYYGGCGSGGAVRVVAANLHGTGTIQALGGTGGSAPGGMGRIRIERIASSFATEPVPAANVVVLNDGDTPQIWLPDGGPKVQIISIGSTNAPADPQAAFGTVGADVTLPKTGSAFVIVETTNVESASKVLMRVTPRVNANYTETRLYVHKVITEDPLVVQWTNNVSVKDGYSAMQVRVTRP
jgi:hypothetical protein